MVIKPSGGEDGVGGSGGSGFGVGVGRRGVLLIKILSL